MTQDVFHRADLWEQYGLGPDYTERLQVIADWIPSDVRSVLDAGCGNGEILHTLRANRRIETLIGIDASPQAVKQLEVPAVVGELPALPFAQRSFDLVISLEVLEHIRDGYPEALADLARLAKSYLLIGVPYREQLGAKQVLCADCGRTSHADGHLRSYAEQDMKDLFAEFTLVEARKIGVMQRRMPTLAVWLQQRVGGTYYVPELFVCPFCGSERSTSQRFSSNRTVRKIVGGVNRILTRLPVEHPYWILGLYRRVTNDRQARGRP